MNVRKVVLLAVIGVMALVYFVLYGLACRTGRLEVEGTNKDDLFVKSYYNGPSVAVIPLPLNEFSIWYARTNASSPSVGGQTFVTTTDRLSLGIIAIESVNTAQGGQSGGSGSATASAGS
ncbi:MAG: hypothetical protein ACLQVD_22735 [Capsulimonadaceae bacterium]